MLDSAGPYTEELRALEAAYEINDEGLTPDGYFEKYASVGYKKYVKETISRIDAMEKNGIWV